MEKKNAALVFFLSAIMLVCIAPLPSDYGGISTMESNETSSRNTVHEGDWAAYKQLPLESTYYSCVDFAFDQINDYIAISGCPNYDDIEIIIYHNSQWNEPVDTIETDYYSLDFLQFSPSGDYLIAIDDEN